MVAATSSASTSLKEYLKRYENKNEEEKKKKKKKKTKPVATGVVVVDEDPVWQKPVKLEDEHDDSADEEKPLVDEDIEVKRLKRLEQLRSRRPFGAISEDGSGWVSVSDTLKMSNTEYQYSDISPPRKRKARNDTPSPEPEPKHSGDGTDVADLSPPRQRRRRHNTLSPEPDLSPPRKQHRHFTPSLGPEARQLHSSGPVPDFSPPGRQHSQKSAYVGNNSEMSTLPGISPPRRLHRTSMYQDDSHAASGADLSPPRKGQMGRRGSLDLSSQHSSRHSTEIDAAHVSSVSDMSPLRNGRKESSTVKDRPKTGLISGQDIKEENARNQRDDWERFKKLDPSISGRGAEPVYRDKVTGARISKDELIKSTKKDEKPKEIKLEWGQGLAQKREAEARQSELELQKDKPFARRRDDPELDKMFKERVRWGDPMAHLVKSKHSEPVLPNLGDNENMKESGFIIPQDIPSHSWIKRGLDAAPNRYGIRPGRHWDGVDRSTGYEKELFKRMNEKQATEREAYLWSVSDM